MGGGGGAIVAIAAAARQKRIREIVDAFRVAGATSSDRATSFDALGLDADSREARDLTRAGVLARSQAPDRWYLSELVYVEYREAHQRRARTALMIVLIIALAVSVLAISIGRR
jgi:hypothetical protein